jgi:2-keto-3-deoxy-L-rhamnonate aldolase RhmA
MNDTTSSIGTWLSIGAPAIAELAALSGFAWVLIDLEHGSGTEATVPDQLRALRGSTTRGIVRVGAPHPDLIARVLDWGAHGIMVPHVNSAADAEHVVQAAHYAPRGHRGVARTVRACDYGLRQADEVARPLIFAQIETVEAVRNTAEIASVDGVDVIFVGPADLQHALKTHAGAALSYADCLKSVVAAAKTAGKSAGILVRDLTDLQTHRDLGFSHIAVDSDLAILRKAYQQIVTAFPR